MPIFNFTEDLKPSNAKEMCLDSSLISDELTETEAQYVKSQIFQFFSEGSSDEKSDNNSTYFVLRTLTLFFMIMTLAMMYRIILAVGLRTKMNPFHESERDKFNRAEKAFLLSADDITTVEDEGQNYRGVHSYQDDDDEVTI
jgi:hypothetical protein